MTSTLRRAIVGVILLAVALPASGAKPTDEELLPSAQNKDAYAPCAAHGKDVFLVCWQSGRLAKGDIRKGVTGESDIVGVRVGRDGKARDANPVVISTAKNMRQSPRAAFGDGVFLVVWHDLRNGKDWDIYAARVSPGGKVLDPDGISVCTQTGVQALPRVAWDGKAFQIVWQDYRSAERYDVYGARVSSEGKVLDPDGLLLTTQKDRHRYNPIVAPAGEGKSLMIWNGDIRFGTGTIAGGVFLAEGKAEKAVPWDSNARKQGPGYEFVPLCLAKGPKNYLVAWTTDNTIGRDPRAGATNATILDADGTRGISLLLAGKEHRTRDPDAAWDGEAFVAVWHEAVRESKDTTNRAMADAVFTSRVTVEGKVGDLVQLSGSFSSPAAQACVASDGAGLSLVAYEKHPENPGTPIQIGFRLLKAK